MSNTNGWIKVGTMLKNKDPKKANYIKIEKGVNVTLTEGMVLSVQDPRKNIDNQLASGRIDEATAEQRKAKIPDFVLREIVLAPKR
jgi:hypothetical protein